jgi:hypothetical protein
MTILAVGIDHATISLLNLSSDPDSGFDNALNDELQEALGRELKQESKQQTPPAVHSIRDIREHLHGQDLPEQDSPEKKLDITHTDDIQQAIDIALDSDDISLIIIDSKASKRLAEDIGRLLGSTLLTTKILILTHPDDLINRENYSALGVFTQKSPNARQTLSLYP